MSSGANDGSNAEEIVAARFSGVARLLGNARLLVIVAVVGVFFQSLATYAWAVARTGKFMLDLVRTTAWKQDDTIVELLVVLDLYLIGTVLLITAIGLHELFVGSLDVPEWLIIKDFSSLKSKIVDVLVLVIGIKFLEKVVRTKEAIDVLWVGLGSGAVMAVLIAWNVLKADKGTPGASASS